MSRYNFKEIEEFSQERWKKAKIYKTPENPEKKFYLLEMFAYPSGDMHIGHTRNYVIGDTVWRYKKMQGYDLLHPFGWDAFGLPAEQAAIKRGESPKKWTYGNIATSRNTLKRLQISYDWDREIITAEPEYYRWNQWLFLKLFEKGLVYRKKSFVNWCDSCKTVLANEQVIGGECWRCGTSVRKKEMEQWFIRITAYAERLLNDIDKLEGWPENVKIMQRNWIGRSEGAEIDFYTEDGYKLPVFTTRPDTLFGVTFISIAPEHPYARGIDKEEVKKYIDNALMMSEIERQSEEREKTGVPTGKFAIHPFTGEKIEIWVADYVLASYGTGIVMGVPAHDQRDFEFAKKYNIPIKVVIMPPDQGLSPDTMEMAYEGHGMMVNSAQFNGLDSELGKKKVIEALEKVGKGRGKVTYRLRDWLISRQRYWGTPIPVVHCEKCGIVPVPEEQLPVLLPPEEEVNFIPTGRSPLEDARDFYHTKCPKCGGPAHRDADTMDTFVDSSWYHLRYFDPHNDKEIFSKEEARKWHPIDLYIGGVEHATGHLIYFRFMTKFLYDLGYLDSDEPALALFNQGMVMDEKGEVMSKSKENVVSPIGLIERVGVDATRIAILFAAPPERDLLWSEKGVKGAERFLSRIYNHFMPYIDKKNPEPDKKDPLYRGIEKTKKIVTEDLEHMRFNTGIAALMEMLNQITAYPSRDSETYVYVIQEFTKILAPFAPHLAEFLYAKFGEKQSIFLEAWPSYHEDAVKEEIVTVVVQVNGKVRARLEIERNTSEEEVIKSALSHENVKRHIDGKEIRKTIYIKNKILNIVAR
ncbi:leucine--tRNA ligase [candidate division WOR-3 bacterium]|nr:leucine--tRNA ligase [candidate division WOR-3 bacterium]